MKPVVFHSRKTVFRKRIIKPSGLTLIELLVVIAIIGVLIAILLPAVQAARESARRMTCANNLRQVGLALHNFESTYKYYPSSWKGTGPIGSSGVDGWSAHSQLLPFMEQVNLASTIDFTKSYNDPVHANVMINGEPQRIAAARIGYFLCPDDPGDNVRADGGIAKAHYPLNYGANVGVWFVFDPASNRGGEGAFYPNSRLMPGQFRDGLSNTLAFAEVKAYNPYYRNLGSPTVLPAPTTDSICGLGGDYKTNSGHTEWVDGRAHQTGFTCLFPPNTKVLCEKDGHKYDIDWNNMQVGKSTTIPTFAAVTARSYHPAGLNALRMDGSVDFVQNSISQEIWQALGTRSGGEVNND